MLINWFEKFINPSIKDNAIKFAYAKNILGSVIMSLFAGPLYALLYFAIGFDVEALIILAELFFIVISGWLFLHYYASIKWARRSIVASMLFIIVCLCYRLGGIYNPVAYWLVLPPLLAIFFGSLIDGFYCFCAALLIAGGLLHFHSTPRFDAYTINTLMLIQYVSIIGLTFIVATLAALFESSKRDALTALITARTDLEMANERQLAAEQRELNMRLDEQNQELLASTKLKNLLLANMSHEFRTPLTGILGFAELLLAKDLGPINQEQQNALQDIINCSQCLLKLISSLLELATAELGRLDFHIQAINLQELTQQILNKFAPQFTQKNLSVHMEIDPSVNIIHNDVDRITQVIENYVSNAIKFTQEGGDVNIRIKPDGDKMIRIVVQDTGIGIASEDIPKLFVGFHQLDFSSTKKYSGCGLGLAMVKHIVEAQGGTVGVTSMLHVGSNFFAILPRNLNA